MKYQGKTIRKTKNNTWYTRYRFNGKQYFISAKTQIDCYNKLKRFIKQNNNSQVLGVQAISQSDLKLCDWFSQWLDLYKINKVKEATINDYKKSYSYISKELLSKSIREITAIEVLKMLNGVNAERVRQKLYDMLKMLFDKALKNELVSKNIMINIDKPKHEKENSQPLTIEQEQQFITVCKQVKYGDYFLICLYQGLRKGEALAITREDIDYINKTLTINKSINDNNQVDTTKNKHSVRTIPLFADTLKLLEKYKSVQGRVFNFSPKIQKLAIRNINKLLTFHVKTKDLRSTFITRCQENNIPEFIIQSWVGHRIGSKVTSSVYTKYNEQDNAKYINIFNKAKKYSKNTHKTK